MADEVRKEAPLRDSRELRVWGKAHDVVLAAQRAGISKVVLPRENEADLEDLPKEARKEIEFVLVDSIDEVLEVAFDSRAAARPRSAGEVRQAARAV